MQKSISYTLTYADDSETRHTTAMYSYYWEPDREIAQHAQREADKRKERVRFAYRHIGCPCTRCSKDGVHRDWMDPRTR